ncbi:MAG: BA14K family protein [Hyphomicrobiales bacterium]
MFNKYYPLALAALLGMGAFAVPVSSANAAAIPAVKQIAPDGMTNGNNPLLVDVTHACRLGYRCGNHRWNGRWDGRGHRHRHRHRNFVHFHGGYFYDNPWWLGTTIVVAAPRYAAPRYYGRMSSRHVNWCFDNYRSYRPRTNTWVSYSGQVRQCISPYSY